MVRGFPKVAKVLNIERDMRDTKSCEQVNKKVVNEKVNPGAEKASGLGSTYQAFMNKKQDAGQISRANTLSPPPRAATNK